MEALSNKTGFVPINRTIRFPFDPENLFAADQVLIGRGRDKSPGAGGLEGLKFFKHGFMPVIILGGLQISSRHK